MVAARTREIGVRLAIGADRRDILWMVIGRGARLAVIGGVAGLAAGYLAGRSFQAVLAGGDPADAFTLGSAVLITTVMTLCGSLAPAVRAARTNPLTATRAE
jgi:ABC-type antimicrobial peptide transport system permease subunit